MSDGDAGSCGGEGSEGSTASVREDHSIITVATEGPDMHPAHGDEDPLTTVVISSSDLNSPSHSFYQRYYYDGNGGIDNLAFQSDAGSSEGDKCSSPPAEAVNLELVNMAPAKEKMALGNGHHATEIPVKNGKDPEGGPDSLPETYNSDPYDEYFVPVNEHRKYIRGEKLYVTKDKRQQHKWRRTVCWGVALTLLAAAVLIAVLAATGVILSQEEDSNSLNARLASSSSSTSAPSTTTSTARDAPSPPTEPPLAQPYVPRALEAKLTINDREFEEALSRPDSQQFKELAKTLEEEIKLALFDHQTLNYGAADISVKVMEFMPGSVVVRYRVAWRFKPGIHNPRDPISEDMLKDKMTTFLSKNGGYLYVYRIAAPSVSSSRILDPCQANNGGCSHTCAFDYNSTLRAMCSCPAGMHIAADQTTCMDDLKDEVEPPVHAEPNPGTVESGRHFPDHTHFEDEVSSTPDSAHPEPSSEPEPSSDHDHSHHDHAHHDHSTPEPEPGTHDTHHEHGAATPEPSGHEHDDKSTPEPEPSTHDTEHHHHHGDEHDSAKPEPSSEDEKPSPEPVSEGDHHHSHIGHIHYGESSSTPEPAAEGDHHMHEGTTPEPASEGDHHHSHIGHIHEESSPAPEPTNGGDHHDHMHENGSPKPEPASEGDHHHGDHMGHMHEDATPKPEPASEGDHHIVGLHGEPPASPEPSSEGDHDHGSTPEPVSEGKHEDSVPKPEPPSDHHGDHHSHDHLGHIHSVFTPAPDSRTTLENEHDEHSKEEAKPEPNSSDEHSSHDVHIMHIHELKSTTETSEHKHHESESKETSTTEKEHDIHQDILMTDQTTKKTGSEKSHEEVIPDQIYSDRDVDEEDVIGPVTLELRPPTTKHSEELKHEDEKEIHDLNMEIVHEKMELEHKEKSSVELAAEHRDSEAELPPDNTSHVHDMVDPHKPHEDSTAQKPMAAEDAMKEKKTSPETMAMMERGPQLKINELHIADKENSSPRHVEIVQLIPVNITEEKSVKPSELEISDMNMEKTTLMPDMEEKIKMTTTESMPVDHMRPIFKFESTVRQFETVHETTTERLTPVESEVMSEMTSSAPAVSSSTTVAHHDIEKGESHDLKLMEVSTTAQPDSASSELTPAPSSTPHTPSMEYEPTSEPEFERQEDEDNDLLGPHEEIELNHKSPRFEIKSKDGIIDHSTVSPKKLNSTHVHSSDNHDVNDIFLKENEPILATPGDGLTTSSTVKPEEHTPVSESDDLLLQIHEHEHVKHPSSSEINIDHSTENSFNIFHEFDKVKEEEKIHVEDSSSTAAYSTTEETVSKKHDKPLKKLNKNKPYEKESEESSESKEKELEHRKMDRLGVALDAEDKDTTDVPETTEMLPTTTESVPSQDALSGEGKLDVRLDSEDEGTTEGSEGKVTDMPVDSAAESSTDMPKTTEAAMTEHVTEAEMESKKDSPLIKEIIAEEKPVEEKTEKKEPPTVMHIHEVEKIEMKKETEEHTEKVDIVKNSTEVEPLKDMTIKLENLGENVEASRDIGESFDYENENMRDEIPVVSSEAPSTTSSEAPTRAPAPVFEEPAPPAPSTTSDPAVVSLSKCSAGQFQCVNGTAHSGEPCVSASSRCDSVNDCSDASDELGCIEDGCPGNFQCLNRQCLKRNLVCNGILDCTDGSDEADCAQWKCTFDELQCPSGRCIPLAWQCDGKSDCGNNTDEQNCHASCGAGEFMCPERRCIPLAWKCNGREDCAQGDDEKQCDCSAEEFRCSGGGCVAKSHVCDGESQCPDRSDEWNCLRVSNDSLRLQVRSSEGAWMEVCSDSWDKTWSNSACQALGYSDAVYTEFPSLEAAGARVVMLKPSAGNATIAPLLGAFEKAPSTSCASGKAIEISCQEFSCGRNQGASVGLEARLVGGSQAADGQWSSVALMYNSKKKAGCTASIVSPMWLLTSLSCLSNKDRGLSSDQWQVFAGSSVFKPEQLEQRTQARAVRTIVAHPQARFNRFLYEQDVALVRLSEPLSLGGLTVGAICLTDRSIVPRQLCVTAGWGYSSRTDRDGSLSQYLHYLPVPTIDMKECNSSRHYNGLISAEHICAGFTDAERSPCDNDEGAPLMCANDEGVWELQGLLSHHSHCGRGFHPSVFTSVSALRPWIDSTLGSHFYPAPEDTTHVRR